jgi:hypothetical protein
MSVLKAAFLPPTLFTLLLTAGCATGQGGRLSLLSPGIRSGAQSPRSLGGGWLALCKTGGSMWTLQPTALQTRRVHDEQVDQPGERTGREIRSDRPSAFCLLRHKDLQPGNVPAADFGTLQSAGTNLLNRMGFGTTVVFSVDSYLLRATDSAQNQSNYTLSVSVNGGTPQTLGDFERGIEPAFESVVLVWAGDLNRDGVADFLFEHKSFNRRAQSLYLSTRAGGGYQKAGHDAWTDSE